MRQAKARVKYLGYLRGLSTACLPDHHQTLVLLHQVEDVVAKLQAQEWNSCQQEPMIVLHNATLTLKMGSRCLCCVMDRLLLGLYTTQLPAPSTTPLLSTFKLDSFRSPAHVQKSSVFAAATHTPAAP